MILTVKTHENENVTFFFLRFQKKGNATERLEKQMDELNLLSLRKIFALKNLQISERILVFAIIVREIGKKRCAGVRKL
jgi:hypothetical protein